MPLMQKDDTAILKSHPVDFVAFSYYNSRCIASEVDPANMAAGNLFASAKIRILNTVNGAGLSTRLVCALR